MISKNNYNLNWPEFFSYTENSPSGLVWKTLLPKAHSIRVGDTAGTRQYRKNGEPSKWMVKLSGKNYSCAKIVFILNHGYIDNDLIIDHIDTNPFNNKISNLRAVTEPINLKNKKYQSNNTSGFTGVSVIEKWGAKYYVATWMDGGKQQSKSYSVKTYGELLAKMLAICSRHEKLSEIDSENQYSSQHYNEIDDECYKIMKEATTSLMALKTYHDKA